MVSEFNVRICFWRLFSFLVIQLHKIGLRCTGNKNEVLIHSLADFLCVCVLLRLRCMMWEKAEQQRVEMEPDRWWFVDCSIYASSCRLPWFAILLLWCMRKKKQTEKNIVPVQLLIFGNVTSGNMAHAPARPSRPRSAFISPGNIAFSVQQTMLICHVCVWVIVEPSVETLVISLLWPISSVALSTAVKAVEC